jgi:putative two-component system response regulator
MASMPKYAGIIDDEFVHLVYQTSPLHDIGKVGIPDSILLKPGRYSDDEFELMKAHTTIGAETLDAALAQNPKARFLQVAREIAAAHHERYDGRGYPLGLSGEEIPLSARIVAVADVYDALTSKRVYKDAFAHHVARNIILKDSGTHFDPDVVDAFLAVEAQFVDIRNALFENEPNECRLSSLVGAR